MFVCEHFFRISLLSNAIYKNKIKMQKKEFSLIEHEYNTISRLNYAQFFGRIQTKSFRCSRCIVQ